YRFAVTISEQSAGIAAEATVTFRLLAPASHIELDLVAATRETGMVVSAVTTGGRAVSFEHQNNRLRVPVPSTITPGHDVSYTIVYGGTPAEGLKVFTNIHGERVVFSEGWPNHARHWLPMIDHPYDKATGDMIVTAPAQFQVVSNGLLVEEVDVGVGQRRTHWRQSVPIASWLFAVGIARFDAHHSGSAHNVPLQTWAYPQDRVTARTLFEETSRRALDFFSTRIGPYPYEKLANVQASGFGGGMENATVIFYGEKGVASGRGPVVHEIAHQWFGNSVTERDWDDVWLSEGFATYFALLYDEQFGGRDVFVDGLRRSRASILEHAMKLPDTPVVHRNLDDMERVLNNFVYQKGGWVLHMLRDEVGADAFWAGTREYYRRYRDRNASTSDFRQVMEQVSGKELTWFFAQWLNRGGNPRLEGSWRYDARRNMVDVTITQAQAGEPFRLKLAIGIRSPNGVRTEVVQVDRSTVTVSLPADVEPAALVFDPDTWTLADFGSLVLTRSSQVGRQ
ncbi:MAG: M1 family metallopeptidase, partial [Acidobacteria bacterium]|nr:M1 family metallopeptidase [Acidobacteriota bacterium]